MAAKFVVSVFLLSMIGATIAAPAPQEEAALAKKEDDVKVVRYINENNGIDKYLYTYELDNGQIVSEEGHLKEVVGNSAEGEPQAPVPVIVVTGQYSWIAPDGQTYWVNYTADENGFHPVVGTGPEGGIKPGQDAGGDHNAL